jgi:D-alanyl-D-alanine carboxypeptidase
MQTELVAELNDVRRKIESPGLAVGVLNDKGKMVLAACGEADLQCSLPLTVMMPFPAGSIIKPFIGVVALQLAAEGALSLDDPLRKWVPEFIGTGDIRVPANSYSKATLRQVLNHSAGIKCFTELLYWLPYELQLRNAQQQWGDADAIAIANHFPPYFEPGTDFHYSNCGYALLGLALERAASAAVGREVEMGELLRDRVFSPVGVSAGDGTCQTRYIRYDPPEPNTQSRSDSVWPELQLRGYMKPEHGGHDVTSLETYGLYGPAGALLSSLTDLLRLSEGLHTSPALLAPEQYSDLLDVIPAGGPGKFYGLGVQVFDRDWAGGRFIGHGGNVMGVSSGMWYFPDRGMHLAFVANRALVWERPIFEFALESYASYAE